MSQDECRRLWAELKAKIRSEIKQIDAQTEWTPSEPDWWLQMMRVFKEINEDV